MADNIQFSILDPDHAIDKIIGLPNAMRKKGARFGMRKAANLVRDKAKDNARRLDDPDTAEEISKNIQVRFSSRRFKRSGDVMFRVGVLGGARATGKAKAKTDRRRKRLGQTSLADLGEIAGAGKNNPGGDTFYWRFVEFGTERSRAEPFMRPALANNITQATSEAAKHMSRWLGRNINKIRKNGI